MGLRAIKLTTSRYFTPTGKSIHGEGISPDIYLEASPRQDDVAAIKSHLTDPGAALLQTDTQLRKSLLLLQEGRIVQSKAE